MSIWNNAFAVQKHRQLFYFLVRVNRREVNEVRNHAALKAKN